MKQDLTPLQKQIVSGFYELDKKLGYSIELNDYLQALIYMYGPEGLIEEMRESLERPFPKIDALLT